MPESELNRLLRAAAREGEPAASMPYGFDTRVVALAREEKVAPGGTAWELARLLPRIAFAAVIVIAFSASAAYWELEQIDDAAEPAVNAYAIVDTAIEAELAP